MGKQAQLLHQRIKILLITHFGRLLKVGGSQGRGRFSVWNMHFPLFLRLPQRTCLIYSSIPWAYALKNHHLPKPFVPSPHSSNPSGMTGLQNPTDGPTNCCKPDVITKSVPTKTDVRLYESEGEQGKGCKGISQIILNVENFFFPLHGPPDCSHNHLLWTQASWWNEELVLWYRKWATMKRWAVREQQRSLTHSRALCQHALVRSGIPEWQVTVLSWQMGVLR